MKLNMLQLIKLLIILGTISFKSGFYVYARGEKYETKFFYCNDTKRIKYECFCDGDADCKGGEDEPGLALGEFHPLGKLHNCTNSENSHDGFCVVSRDQICDGIVSCSNLSPCDLKCKSHYKCTDGSCYLRTSVCDSNPCTACPEDHEWSNGIGFKCVRNGATCMLPQQLLHDDVEDCDGGVDICFKNVTAMSRNERQPTEYLIRDKCFQCMDKSMIVRSSAICDHIIDCPDLSDECFCEKNKPAICDQIITQNNYKSFGLSLENLLLPVDTTTNATHCQIGDVRCKNDKCISRHRICDGVKDCDEDESEGLCDGTLACKDAENQEKCRCVVDHDVSCRRYYGVSCNGLAECPPRQDPGYVINTLWEYPEDECIASCSEKPSNFTCVESASKTLKQSLYGTWCEKPDDGSVLPDDYTKEIDGEKYCDGVIDCELMGDDESHCIDEFYRFYCNSTRPGYVSISEDKVCDGILDCTDGKDEIADVCKDSGRSNRFRCSVRGGLMISIDSRNLCDFSKNCDNETDEMNCTDDRFYCENGQPLYVMNSQKRDGIGDCSDWSDECPTINKSTSIDAFSSRYELIESSVLRTIIWIMALLAIIGNAAVIIREIIKLRQKTKITPAMRANRLLILNLALADFLMGIYLISLCVMTLKMQGDYCSRDLAWRSSKTCIGLGVLSVAASETSVITMILLTGCRLYAISNPFQSSRKPSPRHLLIFILGSWMTSLILGLLPLTPGLSRIFVSGVKFKNNPFATAISTPLATTKQMFSQMVLTKSENISQANVAELNTFLEQASWDDLKNDATKYFDFNYFDPEIYWGYYSTASVCIPKFFITRSDPAWVFSFILTLFNFVAFTFVVVAYISIYFKSRKDVNVRGPQKNDEKNMKWKRISSRRSQTKTHDEVHHKRGLAMQRKILRLIITDFCCWVPICIMSFCKLAGVNIQDTAYAVAAIVLLPINSALNPILYSDMVDAVYKKIQRTKDSQCSSQRTSRGSSKSTHFTKIEMHDKITVAEDQASPAGSVL
ncbi:uncharacterized protein LOC120334123 isoform X1 [Styela clava]